MSVTYAWYVPVFSRFGCVRRFQLLGVLVYTCQLESRPVCLVYCSNDELEETSKQETAGPTPSKHTKNDTQKSKKQTNQKRDQKRQAGMYDVTVGSLLSLFDVGSVNEGQVYLLRQVRSCEDQHIVSLPEVCQMVFIKKSRANKRIDDHPVGGCTGFFSHIGCRCFYERSKLLMSTAADAVRLFPMRFNFELQICIFRPPPPKKNICVLMQSKQAKSDPNNNNLVIRWPN